MEPNELLMRCDLLQVRIERAINVDSVPVDKETLLSMIAAVKEWANQCNKSTCSCSLGGDVSATGKRDQALQTGMATTDSISVQVVRKGKND